VKASKLFRVAELVADPFDNRRLTEQFTAAAIRFIDANRNKPFFLYLPFTAPHFPALLMWRWQTNLAGRHPSADQVTRQHPASPGFDLA